MIFVAAIVALHVAVFAWRAVDEDAGAAALPLVECMLALIGLMIPRVRRGMVDAVIRYWPAVLALAALIALTFRGPAHPLSLDPHLARGEAWRLIGFLMGALSAIGGALATGRRQTRNALLAGAIALGALAVISQMQGQRPLFAASGEATLMFALLSILSANAGIDALAARGGQTVDGRTTRAQRLLLPLLAFLASMTGLALTAAPASIAAFSLAIAALLGALMMRERRRGAGALLLGAVGALSLAGGAVLLYLAYRAGDRVLPPLTITIGAGVMLAGWATFLVSLGTAADRRKRPSRGFAVALACGALCLFASASIGAPAAFATLALLVGLAGAQTDDLTRLSPEPRS